ncbi:MAG: 1,4-dihydroxy-2-naphthoate polyprenyltransferase [Deltaproteobacteria bacterium]|nr:1,4-dihydroxy-2-naphthoate polyprenyltransferase [Deltaproteobacteria bacterium]
MAQDTRPEPPGAVAVWILAARPKTLWASISPVVIGIAMAFGDGGFHAPAALVALACSVLIQVATNFANDLFDYEKGADTEARQGPMRVTQAGLVTPGMMKRGIFAVLMLTLLGGLYLIWRGGWPAALIGVLSVTAGLLYTGGPRPLGYLGLGDLFVLIFFGPVAVAGTYYVQALTVNATVIIAGLAPGLLSVAILAVNNLRDADEDRRTGKRTLAVRFGPGFTRAEYIIAVVVACILPLVLYLASGQHPYSVAAVAVVAVALPAFRRLFTTEGPLLNPVLAYTARLLLLYSAVFSIGWIL